MDQIKIDHSKNIRVPYFDDLEKDEYIFLLNETEFFFDHEKKYQVVQLAEDTLKNEEYNDPIQTKNYRKLEEILEKRVRKVLL